MLYKANKFDGGDVDEYLEHFEICALANAWEPDLNCYSCVLIKSQISNCMLFG